MRTSVSAVCFVVVTVVGAAGCEPEPCTNGRQTVQPGEDLIIDCRDCTCVDGDDVDCGGFVPDCGPGGDEGEGEEGEGEEGEGEGEEGEGEEGEGEEGEGEGEDAPDCVVDSVDGVVGGVPAPLLMVVVRGVTPVIASAAGAAIPAVSFDGGLAFVPDVVGDYVVGADADRCVVHVLPPSTGLFVEALWSEPVDADVDLSLARVGANNTACAGANMTFPGVDVVACAAGTDGYCSYANCNAPDAGRGRFDGVDGVSDSDALSLRDSVDAGSEAIVLTAPAVGRYFASVYVFSSNTAVDVSVRAWLDGVLVAEQQATVTERTSGIGLLVDVSAARACVGDGARDACSDDDDVCAVDDDCGAGLVCGGGACNGDADLCSGACVGCDDGACVPEVCVDADDVGDTVDDAPVVGAGFHENVTCPGDVDVFALDVEVGDTVFVSSASDATIAGPDGPLVGGVVTALPVTLTLRQRVAFIATDFTVTVFGTDQRCDDEAAFEPNDTPATANPFRDRGMFCGDAVDVDCVTFDAFSVVDVSGACVQLDNACVPSVVAFAGPGQPLCLSSQVFESEWTLTRRAVDCSGVVDEAVGFDVVDGASGVFCGANDREFGELTVPANKHLSVVVNTPASTTVFPAFLPRRAPRTESLILDGVPPLLSDGTAPWTFQVTATDVVCAANGVSVDEGVCIGVVGDGCDAPVDIRAVDLDACADADSAGCLDACVDDRFFRLGVLDGPFRMVLGANAQRRFSLVRSRGDGTFTTLQQLEAPSVVDIDGDGGSYAIRVRNSDAVGATPWSLQLDPN